MPKELISTYSTVMGNKVQKIFCEETVLPKTKEVSVFEKYSSKKSLSVKYKETIELAR